MRVGIDCRFWGPRHTGLGRYTKNLVSSLLKIDKKNNYVLFLRKEDRDNFQFPICSPSAKKSSTLSNISNFQNTNLIETDFPHYSFQEQFLFPPLIKKAQVDLVHFPHFNIPIFYRGKFVVTIHDLIKNQFLGTMTTTRNPLVYYFKYLNYRLVIKRAIKNSFKIITPSNFVKKEIMKNYPVRPSKVKVVYEGVDSMFRKRVKVSEPQAQKFLKNYKINRPFLLYVGNLYFHKNLIQLIKVLTSINQTERIYLVVVSARDKFYQALKGKVSKTKADNFVKFLGFVPDEKLQILYQEALAFINPSLMEGFGLPGLEALSSGCLVLSSNRGALPEIYREAAIYFNPENPQDLEEKIKKVVFLSKEKREKMIKKGLELAREYSWKKCAQETLRAYKEALKKSEKIANCYS